MDTDSFNKKYSVRVFICGIFSIILVLSLITFPKDRNYEISNLRVKSSRPYKSDLISRLSKEHNQNLRTTGREKKYYNIIHDAAERYGVEPALIKAIIMAESSYNHRAISKRGAVGLMQLMPKTADALGVDDLFDPALNIDGGARYIKQLLDQFDGDIKLALAAYNAGSRKVRKYNGVPPFKATKIYVKKVFDYYRYYQLTARA